MESKEAKRWLEFLADNNFGPPSDDVLYMAVKAALETAISALDKQIAKPAKDIHNNRVNTRRIGYCPSCDAGNDSFRNYCPYCGQKIDWSEGEQTDE